METRKMKITCGADPEMFLQTLTGELRSSIGLIGGSKYAPMPLPIGDGYAVQEDNVAVEFNIPPAANAMEFINSINKTLGFLTGVVDEHYGLGISRLSAASFPEAELQSPAALEFGCEPDFNAWTGKKNPKPAAADKNLRSCGGHIHIGYDKSLAPADRVIRMMDLHVGVPSVLMDNGDLRKQLYGKAGAYREKSYGAEYRTLSNFWIFEEKLIGWAWNNTERAVEAAVAQLTLSQDDEARIVSCINNNDKALAQNLVQQFSLGVV
jgi:hypothetical protein